MKNLNEFYTEVAKMEKGKQEVNIAQIKEVLKCAAVLLFRNPTLLVKFLALGEKWSTKL